ncbi:MAG TPA: tetratricopeptide repeat protein [Tepidisphaeraceae bacterium]|nr:tetratricopeptide repeat protein [Tepidisphaeraceae bacterium]
MIEPKPAADVHADEDLLAALTDDFLRRHRAGEHPSVDEYAKQHPHLADQIRDLFPAMVAMEHPGFAATLDPTPAAERVGATIGRYKLLERIGEGGFGIVYMAEQVTPVRRKVALKLVKPGMDSRQVLARFDAERQALAIMDHPNIAKVFDGGMTDSGRPYFVMELVKGEPITGYCDGNQLPPRQRLELFVQVCDAVQHAHQKGIIHRDIKPTNVLVSMHDTTPVVKVIDFGVAKALGQALTENSLFTGFAQLLGTPLYMSPEQAGQSALDVDTRSDIYSLGVLLYELLTGTTPFDRERFRNAAQDEMRRIIREEEPPRPSTRLSESKESLASISVQRHTEPAKLTKMVRGELDWIVMKALEKDRSRRYETANGLARDVERYLQDEPVHACPPSAAYRLRKIARRHRVKLGVAAGFVLLLVGATLVSSALAVRARRAETLAQARLEAETQARARAVTEAAKATTISDLLLEMFSSAHPDQSKGPDYTVRQLLQEAAPRMRDQLKGQPEVDAAISAAIGNVYRRLGLHENAEPHLQRALAVRRSLVASGSPQAQALIAQSLLDSGWNQLKVTRLFEAERELREAIELFKKSGAAPEKVIEAMSTLQLVLNNQNRLDEASALADEALALGAKHFPQGHAELANVMHRLAATKQHQADFPAAEALARKAVAMHERWHGKDHVETGWSLAKLGDIQTDRQQYSEAEANLRRARSIFLAQYGDSHYSLPFVMKYFRRLYQAKGDHAALAALEAEDRARLLKSLERDASNLKVPIELGDSLRQAGDLDGAIAKYDEVFKRRMPDTSADVIAKLADGYDQLGPLLRVKQRSDEAARAYRQAIALREPVEGAAPEVRLKQSFAYHDLAFCVFPAHLAEAEGAVRKGLALRAGLVKEFSSNAEYRYHLAHSHIGLSIISEQTRPAAEAVQELREAVELLEGVADVIARTSDPSTVQPSWLPQEVGKAFWGVVDRFVRLRDYPRAEAMARRAIEIFQQLAHAMPNEPYFRQELAVSYRKLGEVFHARGEVREAQRQFEIAKGIYQELIAQVPQSHFYRQELAYTVWSVGNMLARHGYAQEAVRELRVAVDLHKKAADDFPKERALRDRQMEVTAQLAALLVRNGSYQEAVSLVVDPNFKPVAWGATTAAAAVMASAIDGARADQTLDDERRDALVTAWAPHVQRLVDLAVQQCPTTSANDLNGLAWRLATANGPLSRDPHAIRAAVQLAAKAVELRPDDGNIRNTLGVTHYRTGDWKAAIAALEKAMELRNGGDSFDCFFLATAHWQLDNKDEARQWYARAVEWMEKKAPANEELIRFRAEAAELLGIKTNP